MGNKLDKIRHEKRQDSVIVPTTTITRPQVYTFKHKLNRSNHFFPKTSFYIHKRFELTFFGNQNHEFPALSTVNFV